MQRGTAGPGTLEIVGGQQDDMTVTQGRSKRVRKPSQKAREAHLDDISSELLVDASLAAEDADEQARGAAAGSKRFKPAASEEEQEGQKEGGGRRRSAAAKKMENTGSAAAVPAAQGAPLQQLNEQAASSFTNVTHLAAPPAPAMLFGSAASFAWANVLQDPFLAGSGLHPSQALLPVQASAPAFAPLDLLGGPTAAAGTLGDAAEPLLPSSPPAPAPAAAAVGRGTRSNTYKFPAGTTDFAVERCLVSRAKVRPADSLFCLALRVDHELAPSAYHLTFRCHACCADDDIASYRPPVVSRRDPTVPWLQREGPKQVAPRPRRGRASSSLPSCAPCVLRSPIDCRISCAACCSIGAALRSSFLTFRLIFLFATGLVPGWGEDGDDAWKFVHVECWR